MKTLDGIIDDIFERESDRYHVSDQPTARGGITLPILKRFCLAMQPNRQVSVEDLQAMTHEEARGIISWLLGELSREMGLDGVKYEPLRLHLLDWGYNSGGPLALRWLQRVLNVPRTGKMDVATAAALSRGDGWMIHHALIAARLQMIDSWTDAPHNKPFEEGLENRALSFSLLPVP